MEVLQGQLTLQDLSEVIQATHEARAKWYHIGLQLKLSVGTLNAIRSEFSDTTDCLTEMCSHWLRCIEPCPSWAALTEVLESPPVGQGHLAQQLRDKYCRGSHVYPIEGPSPLGAPPTSQEECVVTEHLSPQVRHTWRTPQAQLFSSSYSVPVQPHLSHPPPVSGPHYHPPAASYPMSTPFVPPPTFGPATPIHPTYPTPSTPISLLAQPTITQLATSHSVQTVATCQPPMQASVATGPPPLFPIFSPPGAPPTSEPATVTPPPPGVPLDKQSIKQHVKQFEERFCDLVYCTYESLTDKGIEAHRFHAYLMALDVSRSKEHREFLSNLFEPGTTFHNLWGKLCGYWNFLNFNLLEHAVSKFGSEDLKHKMESYVHNLQNFRSVTRVCDFVDCWPVLGETPPKTKLQKFVVKLERDWDRCTLQDLEILKGVITHKFFLPNFALLLEEVEEGCITVTWFLPAPFVKPLLEAIESTSSEFFMEQKIETISIDGQDCYPSTISGYLKEQDTSGKAPVGVSTPGPSSPGTPPTSQGDKPPSICHLPDHVLRQIAILIDTSALRNWRTLASLIPEYTQMDLWMFAMEEPLGRSASMVFLHDLHSRGWTVVDLALLARRAQMAVIVDILKQYCQEAGIQVEFADNSDQNREWKSTKTCFDRPPYPPSPPPPSPPSPSPLPPTPPSPSHPLSSSRPSCSYSLPAQSSYTSLPPSVPPHPSNSARFLPPSQQHSTSTPSSLPPPTHPQGLAEIPYSYLKGVTNDFSQSPYKEGGHKLGEGGFGKVFYCQPVVHGKKVETAVKVLNSMEGSTSCCVDKKQFLTELRALSLLSHECLLPILGYSCNGPHLCLLYPFMSNGSLDTHLPSPVSLPPDARLQVAWDVARALEYLHSGNGQVCVHRDVKSANILLTEQWRGRLGDFGVVRFLPSPLTVHTTTVVGTLVYMAPEYIRGGLVSPAADVYAFGVVLYELLTGKSAQSDIDEEGTDLISYVEEYEGEVSEILIGQWLEGVGQETWTLAEECLETKRVRRPTASQLCVRLQYLHAAATGGDQT